MGRVVIDNFGRGADTTSNPTQMPQGYARVSQNFLHNRGERKCELRPGINRQFPTRFANAPIYALYEYINTSGTQFNLAQNNGSLLTWDSTSTTEIDTGHQSTNIPRFASVLGMWLEADVTANFIGNGTTGYPLQIVAPTAVPVLALAAGTELEVGTYRFDYARRSSITGEISPAYGTASSITTTTNNERITFSLTLAATEQFDQIRIYRTRVGGTQYYELTTQTAGTISYTSTETDASLTTVSTIHTSAGATLTDRPSAAVDVVFHRGRTHLVMASSSRHRWSQINSFSFDSTTDARHDVESDDGDYLRNCDSDMSGQNTGCSWQQGIDALALRTALQLLRKARESA